MNKKIIVILTLLSIIASILLFLLSNITINEKTRVVSSPILSGIEEVFKEFTSTFFPSNSNNINDSQEVLLTLSQNEFDIKDQPQILDVFYKGKTAISQYEKQVLSYLDYLKFPTSLRRGLIIVIASPDFTDQVFSFQNMEFPFKKPSDPYPASIEHICYGQNCFNLIAMKSEFYPSDFYAPLTHELGHAIGENLTAEDWQKLKTLRGNPVPVPAGTPNKDWKDSQFEDFAEVYKVIFGNHKGSDPSMWKNNTLYGKKSCADLYGISVSSKSSMTVEEAYKKTLEELQTQRSLIEARLKDPDCQIDNLYKDMPPTQATKNFINQILGRY